MSKYYFVWGIEILFLCAVNCYAIISGYNYYNKILDIRKVFLLYLQVIFYTIIITGLFYMHNMPVSTNVWMKTIFPVLGSCYWYVTAYFGMLVFKPCMDLFLKNADKCTLCKFFLILVLLYSILPTVFMKDPFFIRKGYSAFWLICLYLVGGYIKKYELNKLLSVRKAFVYFVLCVSFTFLCKVLFENTRTLFAYGNIFVRYTSPTILASAIFLFVTCVNMNFKQRNVKLIKFLAKASFGVYLIHEHPLVRANIIKNYAVNFVNYDILSLGLHIVACSAGIYLFCSLCDILRDRIFYYLRVDSKIHTLVNFIKSKYRISL